MGLRMSAVAASTMAISLVMPAAPASAASPPNDNAADAVRVNPPENIKGSLVGATEERFEPRGFCSPTDASVWYRFTAAATGEVVAQLDAAGEMDATLELFRRTRSRYRPVGCEDTDKKGIATLEDDRLEAGEEYAIRIGRQVGSVAEKFDLRVLIPAPRPKPPGKRLPAKGVKDTVDRLANPGDAYWTRLAEGRTMRVSLSSEACVSLTIFPPGTRSFRDQAVKRRRCGGFTLFTADQSGRHFFLVEAARGRDVHRYRLQTAPARRDDTAPGVFIRNNAKVRGKVNGRLDSVDLYRFDVTSRSLLGLRVSGGPDLRFTRSSGRVVDVGTRIDRRIDAGRYFVAVQGKGKYTLRRSSRTITKATVEFNGRKRAVVSPGSTARLSMRVSRGASGPGIITLQRRDPVAGWQHLRRYRVRVSNGSAAVSFRAPAVGRYRAFGEYRGTRTTAPSETGKSLLVVQGPLVD